MESSFIQLVKNTLVLPQLWAIIIPMQVLGLYSIYNIGMELAPVWWWITAIIGYICFKMIGIAAGYHRLFCHKGFKVNRLVKCIVLYFGVLAGQGSPIMWVALHRGYHHRFSDKLGDPHSPRDGILHSYILWMFKKVHISVRTAYDLMRDPDMVFAHKHYIRIIYITHLIVAIISIEVWLYLLVLPMFITLHCFLIQTCFTHIPSLGYKNYTTNDNSVNSPLLFPIILGEAWHNNHHGDSKNPNYGGRNWWELDPTYWIIKMIGRNNEHKK